MTRALERICTFWYVLYVRSWFTTDRRLWPHTHTQRIQICANQTCANQNMPIIKRAQNQTCPNQNMPKIKHTAQIGTKSNWEWYTLARQQLCWAAGILPGGALERRGNQRKEEVSATGTCVENIWYMLRIYNDTPIHQVKGNTR